MFHEAARDQVQWDPSTILPSKPTVWETYSMTDEVKEVSTGTTKTWKQLPG